MFVLMMGIGTNIQVKADTLGQVKSIKTKTNYKYYKGIVSAKDMRKKKIKYKYGIKASWKKVKNANGYEIYVYGVASKKWRKIKDTKKTSYVFTNLLEKDKFKFKVRAYRKINGEKVYGNWSKKRTIKTNSALYKINNNYKLPGKYYDRYAAEQAFVLQNEYRKSAGKQSIVWSDVLYEITTIETFVEMASILDTTLDYLIIGRKSSELLTDVPEEKKELAMKILKGILENI